MLVFTLVAVLASGLLSLGLKKLFFRRGDWLPIVTTTMLPPLLFVPIGVFMLLRDIGAAARATGHAPSNMVDDFASSLRTLIAMGVIWLVVACPVSMFAVRWLRRRSSL
jgi:hypothetical protein